MISLKEAVDSASFFFLERDDILLYVAAKFRFDNIPWNGAFSPKAGYLKILYAGHVYFSIFVTSLGRIFAQAPKQ